MANAASLYLPGSNLTNLLVGVRFTDLLPAALIATTVTALGLVALASRTEVTRSRNSSESERVRPGPGCVGAVLAAGLVVVLDDPALPVLGLGLLAAALTLDRRTATKAVGPLSLIALFTVATAVGTFARAIDLTLGAGTAATAGIAAVSSVLINNLPAASLLSANHPAHPEALLIGLNLGPNLAVTGSLSALFWCGRRPDSTHDRQHSGTPSSGHRSP